MNPSALSLQPDAPSQSAHLKLRPAEYANRSQESTICYLTFNSETGLSVKFNVASYGVPQGPVPGLRQIWILMPSKLSSFGLIRKVLMLRLSYLGRQNKSLI